MTMADWKAAATAAWMVLMMAVLTAAMMAVGMVAM